MRGVRAAIPYLVAALALSGCMGDTVLVGERWF
jgi:hypothetical protein